ncbi:hypothetical protein ABENE_21555 [Asticcacaulis benevestitus DSM 16100 = ATCC BAA-896]|uniref:Uncharacterized protein n=1 Tax=Asticcacaulis benevestitus DSM 16100 = ATCC BAA-896 TaxID=1121022 RepID=V4P3J5_9CAUL|nr:hypothetical protein ABENE_21555 [Asticcacaulis benevestitus DSM 16100 = ATCC BAA-896]
MIRRFLPLAGSEPHHPDRVLGLLSVYAMVGMIKLGSLPAAKAVISHRHGDRNIDAYHVRTHSNVGFDARLVSRTDQGAIVRLGIGRDTDAQALRGCDQLLA